MEGWIKLNRQITEHWLWKEKPFTYGTAWVDLLLLANWEDKKMPYKGEIIVCKRGDVNLSFLALSKRWGWGRWKVKNFIDLLINDEMVVVNATTHRTTITIVNYDKYQILPTTDCATNHTTNQTTNQQQADITNKDKKDKNIKNIFMPPTVEEVRAYCKERKNNIDAEAFVSFYESKGWMIGKNKMKDWKAAVRTWEQKDKQSAKPKGNAFTERICEKQDYNFSELEKMLLQ